MDAWGSSDTQSGTGAQLDHRRAEILARWESALRQHSPTASAQDPAVLQDSMPEFLSSLAQALSNPNPRAALEEEGGKLAAHHGRDRSRVRGYSLDKVVFEYQLMREVLVAVLDEQGTLSMTERDLLSDAILIAVRTATAEFTRIREEEREQSNAQLLYERKGNVVSASRARALMS